MNQNQGDILHYESPLDSHNDTLDRACNVMALVNIQKLIKEK